MTTDPRWRVQMFRRDDGGMDIRLVLDDDHAWVLSPLEAHKLGSALHALAQPELDRMAKCSCSYFTDVDVTMTDLACPIHGINGTNPAPDQPGRREDDDA